MAYSKQTWDTNSIFNPTRMNHIEDGIESASTATGTEYSSGVSVKDKLDTINSTINSMPSFIHDGIAQNETKEYTFSNGVRFGTVVITRGANAMYSLSNRGAFTLVNDSSITLSYNQSTGKLTITNANLSSEICIMYYVS